MATEKAGRAGKREWVETGNSSQLRGRSTRDTAPELCLRRALFSLGSRYRLNRSVDGFRPDLVFPGPRVAVFVDGCFWHGCPEHGPASVGGPNADLWMEKLAVNRARDTRAVSELESDGWLVLRLWECDVMADPMKEAGRVREFVQERRCVGSPLQSASPKQRRKTAEDRG